jgi:hypothetical protein
MDRSTLPDEGGVEALRSHALLDTHLARGLFRGAVAREVVQCVCPRPPVPNDS